MRGFYLSSRCSGKMSLQTWVIQQVNDMFRECCRFLSYQQVFTWDSLNAIRGLWRRDDWNSHRHRFQNLVLRAPSDSQRSNCNGRIANVDSNVGDMASYQGIWNLC